MALIGYTSWYGNNLTERVRLAKRLGFDYIEICLDYPYPDKITNEELEFLKTCDIRIAFHAPFETDLACPREEISQAGLNVIKKCIKFASQFSPLYFNLHITTNVNTLGYREVHDNCVEMGLNNIKEIIEFGNRYNVDVTVENNNVPFFGTIEAFRNLSEIEGIKFCFDLGHAIKSRWYSDKYNTSMLNVTSEWFAEFNEQMILIHLYNTICSESQPPQNHLAFDHNYLDLDKVMKIIKESNVKYITLEIMGIKEKGDKIPERILEENVKTLRRLNL